jgi:hypothetical protein
MSRKISNGVKHFGADSNGIEMLSLVSDFWYLEKALDKDKGRDCWLSGLVKIKCL